MHFGMAKLVDNPSEAYHSTQWAASIRTTSGEFSYYPRTTAESEPESEAQVQDDSERDPIFPGDMVEFRCAHQICNTCRPKEGVETQGTHTGQVMAIYRDYRTSRRLGQIGSPDSNPVDEDSEGDIILVIGRLWSGPKLLAMNERVNLQVKINPAKRGDFHPQELVLVLDPLEYVLASMVVRRLTHVDFDYSFQSEHAFDDDFQPGFNDRRFVRRAYNRSTLSFVPIGRVSPVPGVLEVLEFGRAALVKAFVKPNGASSVRSLPVLTFADGFGLYRTMYKSCMGVYNEIAALPKAEHARQINVFPLTLGPHGSNFADVIKALEPMKALDKGLIVQINGQRVVLCAPVFAFTGDMPQQQVNSGTLGVTANKGCRSCEISAKQRGDLDFDIISNTRSHFEMLRQRRALDELSTKAAKQKLSSDTGISLERPAMADLAPALDLINTRPGDAAHSEFGGITKMLHQLLLDAAMKKQTIVDYARVLRKMPFPPGWAAIQSPYHVMSYNLQEHARWSVLMTVIARCWLREEHLKVAFVRAIKVAFKDEIQAGEFGGQNASAVNIIIGVLTATVRTNCLLGGDQMETRNPQVFMDIVYKGRQLFQKICMAASIASGPSRGAHGTSRASSRGTRGISLTPSEVGSVMASVEQDVEDKYIQWANRPNVHIGLHYRDVFHRYGLVSLLMVLSGELKHKYVLTPPLVPGLLSLSSRLRVH
ncbi:hypothetical protein F4679DRAFT_572871 [Xylaria curta]|nr:hypothetical protein F4679DRAFT_572871 [Xylaria curta]